MSATPPEGNKSKRRTSPPLIGKPHRNVTMRIYDNTTSAEIRLTEDRLRLNTHLTLNRMANQTIWLIPLTLGITIAIGMTTAETKNALGLSKEFWHALWLLGLLMCVGWLVYVLVRYNTKRVTIEDFILNCKEDRSSTE